MWTQTHVLLDRDERDIILTAVNHRFIAYRDDEDARRRLNGLGQRGDALNQHRILTGIESLEKLRGVIARERKVEYWLKQADGEPNVTEREMARVLAEARQKQYDEVQAAILVLRHAYLAIPQHERDADQDEAAV